MSVGPLPPRPKSGPGWVITLGVLDLPDEAYRSPLTYEQITDAKIYREIMLNRNGKILAAGYFWKILGLDLGHSLIRVSLTRIGPVAEPTNG